MTTQKRSPCPIANALDLLGDRWSLVVVRDLLFRDRHTYSELLDSPEDETFRLPRRDSISYRLIRDWLDGAG